MSNLIQPHIPSRKNAFIAETMIILPPVAGHNMAPVRDLEYKGWKIPKGVSTVFSIRLNHHSNTTRFPNPMEFHIERWIPKGHKMYDPVWNREDLDYNVNLGKFRAFNLSLIHI